MDKPVANVARELGIGENLIYKRKKVILQNGRRKSNSTELNENLVFLKRVNELEMENEILKKGAPSNVWQLFYIDLA